MSILIIMVAAAIVVSIEEALERLVWRLNCPRPAVRRARHYKFN